MTQSLLTGFLASVERFPERPAVDVDGREICYAELNTRVGELAASLSPVGLQPPTITAILAARSEAAYSGILAILYRGETYMPLNPRFPTARLAYMMEHSGCCQLIAESATTQPLESLLKSARNALTVVIADLADTTEIAARHPRHRILPGKDISASHPEPRQPRADDAAYLLYTSGSTGRPKGVAVSHANVSHFLDVCANRYPLDETDRFSQMFDLGFDLSVFDLFMAWRVGGCVCVPQQSEHMLPVGYVSRSRISVWFSVPSVAVLLKRLRQLEKGVFPNLRLSLFCGEALPMDAARSWAEAAPNAVLENLYGPTEATIACTGYRWTGYDGASTIVPIGFPFPGLTTKVIREDMSVVAPGEEGELIVIGPQVALGYWKDAQKTAAAFVTDPSTGARAYRTGDLVRRPASPDTPLVYLGRMDHQVKLHGHRIELGEIESVLREAAGASRVIVTGLPGHDATISGLAAFFECDALDEKSMRTVAQAHLPDYMVPKVFRRLDALPMTPNGKVDRKALIAMLEAS